MILTEKYSIFCYDYFVICLINKSKIYEPDESTELVPLLKLILNSRELYEIFNYRDNQPKLSS